MLPLLLLQVALFQTAAEVQTRATPGSGQPNAPAPVAASAQAPERIVTPGTQQAEDMLFTVTTVTAAKQAKLPVMPRPKVVCPMLQLTGPAVDPAMVKPVSPTLGPSILRTPEPVDVGILRDDVAACSGR